MNWLMFNAFLIYLGVGFTLFQVISRIQKIREYIEQNENSKEGKK